MKDGREIALEMISDWAARTPAASHLSIRELADIEQSIATALAAARREENERATREMITLAEHPANKGSEREKTYRDAAAAIRALLDTPAGPTPPARRDAMSETLLPCPLCDGEVELWRAQEGRPAWIGCMSRCCVLVSREYPTDEAAIAAWNRRPSNAKDAEIARLTRELSDQIKRGTAAAARMAALDARAEFAENSLAVHEALDEGQTLAVMKQYDLREAAEAERDALAGQVEAMRARRIADLQPFATLAEAIPATMPNDTLMTAMRHGDDGPWVELRAGTFRRALAALNGESAEPCQPKGGDRHG